jgi:hypothetical protein
MSPHLERRRTQVDLATKLKHGLAAIAKFQL